jgi:hypothetical protein
LQIYLVVVLLLLLLENDINWFSNFGERERESALYYLFPSWRKLASDISMSFDEASLLLVLLESYSSFLRFLLS